MFFNTENTMEPIYLHALKLLKDCLKLSSTVDDIIVEFVNIIQEVSLKSYLAL